MGVRNHVIVLPVDDLSNAAAEAVANNIKGAMAIPHAYGGCSSAPTSTCISAR
jgi:(2R)-sulfolactate sulfo-lyase subunit beta